MSCLSYYDRFLIDEIAERYHWIIASTLCVKTSEEFEHELTQK